MLKPMLVAFDFDHTIVDDNTDIVVRKLVPTDKISPETKLLYCSDGWTAYMQQIFNILHSNGTEIEQILHAVRQIPATTGLKDVLEFLHGCNAEVIIISDSNSVFIDEWLKSVSLEHTIKKVFTNPAAFNDHGCLKIDMYHVQDWCSLSTKNLCKGQILNDYIQERRNAGILFEKVAYVGDGKNDLCPSLRLTVNDLIFPRIGYALIDCLQQHKEQLKASVHPWKSGGDILNEISKYLSE